MTGREGVPPRRTRSESARGPPARASSETRKTELPPGLPNIGAVSADPKTLVAVYRGLGRNPSRGEWSAARYRRCAGAGAWFESFAFSPPRAKQRSPF